MRYPNAHLATCRVGVFVVGGVYSVRVARSAETVEDITLLVRTPGNLTGYRAFTDAKRAEAELYAAQQGVQVEPLP